MTEPMQRQYTIKTATKRGPERSRDDDGTRILSVKFREPEYARIKRISVETGVPMKELLRRAAIQVYGEPTKEDVFALNQDLPHYPQGAAKKGSEDRFRSEVGFSQFVFTADTVTPPEKPAAPAPPEENTVAEEFFKV